MLVFFSSFASFPRVLFMTPNAKSDYTNNQAAETVNVLHIYVKSRWIRLKVKFNCTNLSLELHISDVELHILCRTAR